MCQILKLSLSPEAQRTTSDSSPPVTTPNTPTTATTTNPRCSIFSTRPSPCIRECHYLPKHRGRHPTLATCHHTKLHQQYTRDSHGLYSCQHQHQEWRTGQGHILPIQLRVTTLHYVPSWFYYNSLTLCFHVLQRARSINSLRQHLFFL